LQISLLLLSPFFLSDKSTTINLTDLSTVLPADNNYGFGKFETDDFREIGGRGDGK
jgi:hypothetical protein